MHTNSHQFPAPKDPAASPTVPIPRVRGHFNKRWEAMDKTERQEFLRFLESWRGGPLVEDDANSGLRLFTFLYQGPRIGSVILSANALVDHKDVEVSEFELVDGADLWAITYRMPADWECGYRITAHHEDSLAPWQLETERRPIRLAADAGGLDPLNSAVSAAMNGGAISVVRGPLAPKSQWLSAPTPADTWTASVMGEGKRDSELITVSQRYTELSVWDSLAGRDRKVWIYSPPSMQDVGRTPLLILHDGQVWARYLNLASSLDAAIAAGFLKPIHVAMVDSFNVETRSQELSGPVGSVDFLARDLLPRLRSELPISFDAAETIVSGASYGGLASLWQLARFPDLFGAAVAQSPSLWRFDLSQEMAAVASKVRIVFQAGLYESDIHRTTTELFEVLKTLDADVEMTSITAGHDWAWWNPWLIRGLSQLFAHRN